MQLVIGALGLLLPAMAFPVFVARPSYRGVRWVARRLSGAATGDGPTPPAMDRHPRFVARLGTPPDEAQPPARRRFALGDGGRLLVGDHDSNDVTLPRVGDGTVLQDFPVRVGRPAFIAGGRLVVSGANGLTLWAVAAAV